MELPLKMRFDVATRASAVLRCHANGYYGATLPMLVTRQC